MEEVVHCIGCGAVIQTNLPDALGYTPKSIFNSSPETETVYCQRCFRLRHYNEIQDAFLEDDDFFRSLQEIRSQNALIVNVVDIFDFNGSIIPGLHRFVGNNSVILVGNKIDVLPKSLKKTRLVQWMRERAHEVGLRPIEVLLISAKKNRELDELLAAIEKCRQNRDVYVVGVTNVGKSTLINAIVKKTAGIQELITTSRFPGTTLDKIGIPLPGTAMLFDTPGIIHSGQMAHFLAKKDLKKITPNQEIKPKVYQLNAGQTLFFGGLARFDFILGEKQGFIAYLANELIIHRTKLSNADNFYEKHLGGILQPVPLNEKIKFRRFEFSITEPTDIVFAGLGWISVKSFANVATHVPQGVEITLRKALV